MPEFALPLGSKYTTPTPTWTSLIDRLCLAAPLSDAVYDAQTLTWTREFAHGVKVAFDVKGGNGTIVGPGWPGADRPRPAPSPPGPLPPTPGHPQCVYLEHAGFGHGDLKQLVAKNLGDCCVACGATKGCAHWTYNPGTAKSNCHLHDANATRTVGADGRISGTFKQQHTRDRILQAGLRGHATKIKTDDNSQPCAAVVTQRIVYLSPSGSDSNGVGSLRKPFATLVRARSRVRELTATAGDICVLLRGGSYEINATVEFLPQDGGGLKRTVTYASYPGERAVLEGGRKISGWKVTTGSRPPNECQRTKGCNVCAACCQDYVPDGAPCDRCVREKCETNPAVVWSAPLAATSAFMPRQVWFGGDRVNETGLVVAESVFGNGAVLGPADTIQTAYGYVTNNSALLSAVKGAVHAPVRDVEFIWRRTRVQWEEDRLRISYWKMLANGSLAITMQQPGWSRRHLTTSHADSGASNTSDFPTSIINLRSTLSTPGTGFVLSATQRVFYVPREGDSMSDPVWVSRFDGPLLLLRGTRGNAPQAPTFVENMAFVSLTLHHASWAGPSGPHGYLPSQSGFYFGDNELRPVTSAFELKTARNVTIRDCTVEHVGGGGIAIDEGSDGVSVTDSVLDDTSCWGVRLGQVNDSALTELDGRTQHLVIHNNVIRNTGVELRGCAAVMGGYLRNSEISHNTITSAQWSGITVGWGWAAAASAALGGNRILNNLVWDTNLACADGGPIYVMGAQGAGQSEMAGNFVGHARHKCSFIYHDEGSSNWWTHNNVVDQPKSQMPPICIGAWSCNEMPGHYGV